MARETAGFWLGLGLVIAGLHTGITRDGIENWLSFLVWFIGPFLVVATIVYIAMQWTGYEIGESTRSRRE